MNICKVWDGDYPWDVRVEKVAGALRRAGHAVHLVARNRRRRPSEEALPEAVVHRLKPARWLPSDLDAGLMFPAFFNPRWVGTIMRTAQRCRANLVLCRDLPLAPTSIYVARRLRIPVVLDMAENYPAMMQALWDSRCQGPMDWLVRNPRIVAAVERWVLTRVDGVIVVVEESKERLESLGVVADRVVVAGNTPPIARLESGSNGIREGDQSLHLVYLGLLEAPRGLAAVIEGVGRARRAGLDVELSLIGDGRERSTFEAQARAHDPTGKAIHFHGRLPYKRALEIMARADVGVVPHVANESWNTTIPNKLFDYMAAGLPVLTSEARPAARVVRRTGCGEVFSDAAELADAIGRLTEPDRRRRYAANGRRAIAERYHWENDSCRLIGLLESLVPTGVA